ncbi:endo-1,4-beta-xylanase [Pelagibacterium sp. 26DY04]|uniref:endo-1,4-beta-xylanase n=1 Tax=Pelagibacterium sp. 26DY04 TaxID=2967130 RepID=UPI00281679C3|nr:endo-1,4-beta-xylanase [Pelagibacterium sp. 26DY04]WMT86767.1 endo-1,4-beta-xylanase [Pelagibacterium sp. 26DY04]
MRHRHFRYSRRRFLSSAAAVAVLPAFFVSGCGMADQAHQSGQTGTNALAFQEPSASTPLSVEAARGRLRFGTAVHDNVIRPGSQSRSIIAAQCSSVTPEWSLKWNSLAPRPHTYNFAGADACSSFAASQGLAMRGHTLLWHLGTPAWAERLIADTREWEHVDNHIARVVSRYRSRVREWDVINEPISGRGDGDLRANQFLAAFGPDYLDWAFHSAARYADGADLFLNEYGLEYANPEDSRKRLALLRAVEGLRNRGAPITGVGLQAHLDLRKGNIYQNGVYGLVRDLTDMGLKVAVTELDVRESDTRMSLNRRDSLVADTVHRYLETVLQFPSVESVSTWGLSDAHSWLLYHDGGHPDNRGLPYDRQWRPKPMRATIASLLGQYRPDIVSP